MRIIMKKLIVFLLIAYVIIGCCSAASATVIETSSQNNFFVLIYHDVPKGVYLDNHAIDRTSFVQQIEYLRTHGYNFISMEDVIRANRGEKELPEKAILLRSDDAYLSFYQFVYPTLELYGYPCLLSVVPSWIDNYP